MHAEFDCGSREISAERTEMIRGWGGVGGAWDEISAWAFEERGYGVDEVGDR